MSLRGQGAGIGEAVGADVNDNLQRRAPSDFHPTLGERAAFVERERMTFARRAAGEDEVHVLMNEVRGLFFNRAEIQRTIGVKGRMRGDHETVETLGFREGHENGSGLGFRLAWLNQEDNET